MSASTSAKVKGRGAGRCMPTKIEDGAEMVGGSLTAVTLSVTVALTVRGPDPAPLIPLSESSYVQVAMPVKSWPGV